MYVVVQFVHVRSNIVCSALSSMLARLVSAVLEGVDAATGCVRSGSACFLRFGTSLLCLKGVSVGSWFGPYSANVGRCASPPDKRSAMISSPQLIKVNGLVRAAANAKT